MPRRPGSATRALTIGGVLGGLAVVIGGMARAALDALRAVDAPGPARPEDGIVLLACIGAVVLASWLWLVVVLEVLAAVPGAAGRAAARCAAWLAPVVVRRAVGVLVGTVLAAAAVPAPAGAVPGLANALPDPSMDRLVVAAAPSASGSGAPDPSFDQLGGPPPLPVGVSPRTAGHTTTAVSPTWTPPRPDWVRTRPNAPVELVSRPPAAGRIVDDEVVVRRHDTLWAIAARHLGPGATVREIAAEWPRWYAANRAVIGSDPDLILVGQRLHPPSSDRSRR